MLITSPDIRFTTHPFKIDLLWVQTFRNVYRHVWICCQWSGQVYNGDFICSRSLFDFHYLHKIFDDYNISPTFQPHSKVKIVFENRTNKWKMVLHVGKRGIVNLAENKSIIIKYFFQISGVNKTWNFCGFCHESWFLSRKLFCGTVGGQRALESTITKDSFFSKPRLRELLVSEKFQFWLLFLTLV